MTPTPSRPSRRTLRLRGYDYTQPGAYFVTICTHHREPLFGQVADGEMVLNAFGKMVWEEWFKTAQVRPYVELFEGEFVIMPNHIHGIVWIVGDMVGGPRSLAPPPQPKTSGVDPNNVTPGSLGAIIRAFKSAVTKRINALRGTPGAPVWQRNDYEHIIRNDDALNRIREYIETNSLRWHLDRENPQREGTDAFDRWLEENSRTYNENQR